ncbi:MAG: hypothetical protein V1667_03090 [bacterium]
MKKLFNSKLLLQVLVASMVATLATAGIVGAATTIGSNINTAGTLTATGATVIYGATSIGGALTATSTLSVASLATLLGGATTTSITLLNGETISNTTDGVISLMGIASTTSISLTNGETITNATNGAISFNDANLVTTGTLDVTGKLTFGGSATAGILHGAGSAGQDNAVSLGAIAGKAMSYYIKTTSATASHALEGMYVTTYHGANATAVAPMGEAGRFRAFLVGDAAAGTIAGSHDSVEISAGGTNTGLTLGTRGNVIFPNEAIGAAGTFAGVQAELNTGGAATDVSGTTASILRLIIDGTAPTAAAQFTIPVISVVLPANLVGDGLIVDEDSADTAVTAKMRITVNGTTYWIPLAASHN